MAEEFTREALIALCEQGRVPQDKWRNRDSCNAQQQMGQAWALLSAGCEFEILREPGGLMTDRRTVWVGIKAEGFNFHDSYSPYHGDDRDDYLDKDHFYLPTEARLKEASGEDWY